MSPLNKKLFRMFIATAILYLPSAQLLSQSTEVIAITGTPAPGGGNFTTFFRPVINNSGQIVFRGDYGPPSSQALFLADRAGGIVPIVVNGQQAPGGSETYNFTGSAIVNDAGLVTFTGFLSGSAGTGAYQGDGTTGLTEVVRTGDPAPDSNGTFKVPGAGDLNSSGQTCFASELENTMGGAADNVGIFRFTPSDSLIQIARKGDSAPDADGVFSEFVFPLINGAGQAAFHAELSGTANGSGIFRGDGGMPVQIARVGQSAPDLDGTFTDFGRIPDLNASGNVTFSATLTGANGSGIFVGDGTSATVQIARAGEAAPDANGSFSMLFNPDINDIGQILFFAELAGTSGSTDDDSGLFRGDGVAPIIQIARKGSLLPDGNGTFSFISNYNLNAQGQVALYADLNGFSGDRGIYFYDDSTGLQLVARKGGNFLGSTITQLGYHGGGGESNPSVKGLSDQGEVTFSFILADGRQGVALWDPTGTLPSSPDVTPPLLSIKGKKKIRTSKGRVKIRGTATDASGIARVEFQPGKGRFKSAKLLGGGAWLANVRLDKSKRVTKVKFRATDNAANRSAISKAKAIRQ